MSKPKSLKPEPATFHVRIVPRSSQSKVFLEPDGNLKVWVNAPPVDGAANAAVCDLIAKSLGVPKSAVAVVAGHSGRSKVVQIAGLDQAEARARLGP